MARFAAVLAMAMALAGCGGARPAASGAPRVAADGIPLGALPRQTLGKGDCGLFLWKGGEDARLVLVAVSGPPPYARIALDGRTIDLPRVGKAAADLAAGLTGAATPRYGDGRVSALLDLTIEPRRGLSDGAVAHGSLRIERVGGDGFVVPVSGLVGCG